MSEANTIHMKTLEELRKLDAKKLLEELTDMEKDLFKVSFEVKNGQSKSHHSIGNHSKQIARIKTIIKERELNNKQKS